MTKSLNYKDMSEHSSEIIIPTVKTIKHLLEPIFKKLDHIDSRISQTPSKNDVGKYYRNNDLKRLFGLSNNTIIKYRETGLLPYTKLGEVYLYEVKAIESIIRENSVKF